MAVHTQAATNVRDDWYQMKPLHCLSTSTSSGRNLHEFQKQIIMDSNNNSTMRHLDVYHDSYLSAEHTKWADARVECHGNELVL